MGCVWLMIVEGEAHHMSIAVQLECLNLPIGVAPRERMIYIRVGQCLNVFQPTTVHQSPIAYIFVQVCASAGHIFSEGNYGGASCKKEDTITSLGFLFCFKPDTRKDLTEAICRLCKRMPPEKCSKITNLHKHLWIHHPAKYTKLTSRDALLSADSRFVPGKMDIEY